MPTKQSLLTLGGRGFRRACSLIVPILSIAFASTIATVQSSLAPGDTIPTGTVLLPVWGPNQEYDKDEIVCYIPAPDSATITEKMEIICDRLSQLMFCYGGIKLMKIDTIEGRTVAEINLIGDSIGNPWSRNYFQGSSGGGFTTMTLRRGFLQETYHGPWVDGVRFHLGGKPIEDVWDHIFLSGIFYRKDAARPGDRIPYGDQ